MRIIAGEYKGRRLAAPTWDGLRPTSDKLRETLFNILAPRIEGARVLDGYAGTGAVGIEAISRGAAHVTFIENNRRAAALIASNLKECGIEGGYTIQCAEVGAALDARAAACSTRSTSASYGGSSTMRSGAPASSCGNAATTSARRIV